MSKKNRSEVPCDKSGRPVKPADASWQDVLKRAALFLLIGALLLPLGLLLYNLVSLPEELGAVTFLFAILIFFGAILLLYGIMLIVLALVQRRKTPSAAELKRLALEKGTVCTATVVKVKSKTRRTAVGDATTYRYTLAFDDDLYKYTRRFVTGYVARAAKIGDEFTVHYFPDTNLCYYVETD